MSHPAIEVRISARREEAESICSFEMVHREGNALPAFSAGSHIDVYLPNGLTRQYSLCNDSSDGSRYLIAVLRKSASRGGSRAMHESVFEGDVLRISAPKNHFALAHEAAHSLLFAGGIGITPILCMAARLSSIGASFEMHYCARSRERAAFERRIQASPFASQVRFHFDNGGEGQKLSLALQLADPKPGTHLYVCGPKGFMDAVLGTARACGWQEEQLHYEFFSGKVSPSEQDASFEVKLARSGRVIPVAKDQTVVQALAAAGVPVETSCEQGVCGTCLTRVLEGEPDHKDLFLTPNEQKKNDQFLPCSSRAKSPMLVLDL